MYDFSSRQIKISFSSSRSRTFAGINVFVRLIAMLSVNGVKKHLIYFIDSSGRTARKDDRLDKNHESQFPENLGDSVYASPKKIRHFFAFWWAADSLIVCLYALSQQAQVRRSQPFSIAGSDFAYAIPIAFQSTFRVRHYKFLYCCDYQVVQIYVFLKCGQKEKFRKDIPHRLLYNEWLVILVLKIWKVEVR